MFSLLGRTLVIVAHLDDEAGGCGVLLQRISHPIVLFATDGAPDDHWFWESYPSRQAYAAARREEAIAALGVAGVSDVEFIVDDCPGCSDQHLYRSLPDALHAIEWAVYRHRPTALLTTAYEGGHPDHDACSFLAFIAGQRFQLPVWEMPLYHRIADGRLVCQEFIETTGSEFVVTPSEAERARKSRMLACYLSQHSLSSFVVRQTEQFRRQPEYRYSQPAHEGMLNYEAWQWPIRGIEVSQAFSECLYDLSLDAQAPARFRGEPRQRPPASTAIAAPGK